MAVKMVTDGSEDGSILYLNLGEVAIEARLEVAWPIYHRTTESDDSNNPFSNLDDET